MPAGVIRSHESSRSSFLPSFVHPAYDIKFADTHEQLESLGFKSTTQRNLKHMAPSVMALILLETIHFSQTMPFVKYLVLLRFVIFYVILAIYIAFTVYKPKIT